MLGSPVVSLRYAITLTLVHPVGDTIEDLVPFTVCGHLHSFRGYVWFEKNVVLGNVNLRNTAESWYGQIQVLTYHTKIGGGGGLNLAVFFLLGPRQRTKEKVGGYRAWPMFLKTGRRVNLPFCFSFFIRGGLGTYYIVPKILSEHLRGFPVIDGVGGGERVPPFLWQTQNMSHSSSVGTVSLHWQWSVWNAWKQKTFSHLCVVTFKGNISVIAWQQIICGVHLSLRWNREGSVSLKYAFLPPPSTKCSPWINLTNVELLRYRDASLVSALCRKTFPSRTLCRYSLSVNMKRRRSERKTQQESSHQFHRLHWHTWNPVQIVGFPPDAVVEVIFKGERPLSTIRFWNQHTLDSVQVSGKAKLRDPAVRHRVALFG